MGVRIEYTIRDGSERHFDVSAFTTEVRMGYLGIAETSLAPLSSLRRLRILTLQYNHIESIDLSPLASCKELREIYLRGNLLKSIDLNPLCTLRHLTSLYLNSNRLVELDLSPLSACHLLAKLDLSKNEIYSIDLTPLYNSPSAHVEIDKDVKATTLVSKASYEMATCKSLLDATTQFDVPTRISDYSWIGQLYSTLRKGEPLWKKYHILCEALRNLDLDWIGIPEVDIDKTLRFIKRTSNRSKASRRLRKMLVAQVCKQIDKGKSCPLLNIEEAKQEPDLVMR
ncbi:MAG: leucine-rich repeat domain-containing protein, partial [Candidatus Thorarchaeota archaeon]